MKGSGKHIFNRFAVIVGAVCIGGFGIWYYARAPLNAMPQCVWRVMTGWYCPGCGSQRFLKALLNGHFREAVSYNYMLLVMVPLLLWLFALEIIRWCGVKDVYARLSPPWMGRIVLGVIIGWWILRNILGV